MKKIKKFNEFYFFSKNKERDEDFGGPTYTGPKETEHYNHLGFDEDANLIGNCKICGSNGVLVHEHDELCKLPE